MPLTVDGQIVIATLQVVYDIFRNAVKLEFKPTIAPSLCSFRDAQFPGVSQASIWPVSHEETR